MSSFDASNKLNDLSLRTKLIGLLMVPILGMVLFSVMVLVEQFHIRNDMITSDELVDITVGTGSLVHELQKERGLSSGYINAKGEKFREELSRQRERSDIEFKKLVEIIAANQASAALVKSSLDAVTTKYAKLRDIRAGIDSLTIEGKDSYAFYTDINYTCLEVQGFVASNSKNADVMRAALSYYSFSKAKEEMGKQRATLNAVLAADKFDDEIYTRIFDILSSQRGHFERFKKFGPPGIVSMLDEAAASNQFRKVEELRNIIIAKGKAGGFGIEPEVWFEAITAQIDLLRTIEEKLSNVIIGQSNNMLRSTDQLLTLIFVLIIFMTALALIFSRMLVNSIIKPVAGLVEALGNIEHGAFEQFDEQSSRRKDEIGNMMRGFNNMVVQLRKNLEQREAAEAKVRDTLDSTVRIVGEYQRFVAEVSKGDLRQRVKLAGDSTGTLGQLGADLNSMTESLAGVASGTTEAINTIYTALEQLQSSINSQSSGASEQAAAVNQTTSSLEQIKAMSVQTLDKVRVLGETAERSRRESEQGMAEVEQATASMASIRERVEGIAQTILALSEQTQQIGEITAVVTNLAQQSKMLALNASIEAAKAGEAGKGFAVVAAEVRELAEQSQQSTAQVQKILQDIRHATDKAVMATEEGSKGVDSGVISVQRSGEAMRLLGEVIRETAMASQQIVAAVRQEAIGIDQVTLAMNEISKVTGQFVTSAQQSKESSAGLRKVAERLRDSVSVYKL